jgi:glycosyltransferase involved in cell wall biosynthesis
MVSDSRRADLARDIAARETKPRTAIVHDWFQGFHGAERTVEVMLADVVRPNRADIYTFFAERNLLPAALARAIVQESRLARLPGVRQVGHESGRWRLLLPYMPIYFNRLSLDAYDLVISSSHAFATNVSTRRDAIHACYCYTPMRYAWMPEVEERRIGGFAAVGFKGLRPLVRRIDRAASRRPDGYAAISSAVRDRVRRFYGRDAIVIYPPVEMDEFDASGEKDEGHFLWVHRLVSYKRPELVIEAFRGSRYRLTMVGVGPLERWLRGRLPPNVELRGWMDRSELARLYTRASGFIHVAEEDFGITMVEALASGTPVIALDSGGARDIVRPGQDGILVENADASALRSAMRYVAGQTWDAAALRGRAQMFGRARFATEMREWLRSLEPAA